MPINRNLNQAPYFDDYDAEKQFYRVMFKPGYAIQARELTQLQTILQGQVESFGDNVFKEGSVVKGCNFTELDDLQFVKVSDAASITGFNVEAYISGPAVETLAGQEVELDYVYELTGGSTGLKAEIVQAARGFQTRPPNLNTFFINYLNVGSAGQTQFQAGETLTIVRYKYLRGTTSETLGIDTLITSGLSVDIGSSGNPHVGRAFGIEAAPGIIFQKGHFIFVAEQRIVVEKYSNVADDKAIGYLVSESLVNALQDASLYDNANGSKNENAPGADRLKLVPTLTVKTITEAKEDSDFFTLARYQNGNAITVRDVSQYNVLGEEMARRTYEESGNYILEQFPLSTDDRGSDVNVVVGPGTAYVKGYRVENSGERSFVIDQITETETIANQNISMEYGNYLEITPYSGDSASQGFVDLDLTGTSQLLNSGGQSIGSVGITNITDNRIYLHSSIYSGAYAMSEIAKANDGNGDVPIQPSSLGAPLIKETSKKSLIFDTGVNGLFGTSNTLIPVRAQVSATASGGTITLTANPGEDFNCLNDDLRVNLAGTTYSVDYALTQTQLNNSQLNIVLDDNSVNGAVTVFYNKRLIGSSGGIDPYNKTVRDTYTKFSYSSVTTKYSLGFPDVFKIVSIVDSTGEDYTNSFRLKTNQKDTYYDISYLEYIEGRPEPSGLCTVNLKVFEINNTTGEYFFTINSYPNTLDKFDIPSYVSDSGQVFNLRDCFDFRPHINKDPAANYSANSGNAPTITTSVGTYALSFSTFGSPLIPAAQQSLQTDIEHYLTRIDTVACDSYGEIVLIKGEEQKFAVPPKLSTDQLAIAHVEVPTYPALSKKSAEVLRKKEFAIKPRATGIKNYTMKDMHDLEKKIDNMAYYISLNQLESETSNLVIRDENGLSRFKNGFVVDPFNDLTLSEINHPQFSSAVPFNQKVLTPSVKTFPLDLIYDSATGASIFPSTADAKAATIGRNSSVDIINQPYASNFRNCVSNFYKYVGDGVISPPYDAAYDTTVNPASIDIDLATPFQDFVDDIQTFLPMTDTNTTTTFERDPGRRGRRGAGTQTSTIITRTSEINVSASAPEVSFVGEFVSNFQFQPYMASRDIKIYMSGLRPNQRHYFFFDGVDVNTHVMPGSPTADTVGQVGRYGDKGAAVSTDANGVLRAVFHLPAETFYVGDRVLEIADVSVYNSIESASTSKGFVTYRAYNFSVEKTSLTTSTRSPNFDVNTTTTVRNVARRIRGRDPLAQTFFVKKGMGAGSNSVYLSEVDVYFRRKPSQTDSGSNANAALNGVSLQIREVVNGYPTNRILPFASVHKLPDDVNVSDDASSATTFTFEAPVRLDVEKEYSIVVQPDASDPNYLIYTSKVGGVDLTPGVTQGSAITQDWGDGVLFTSTNNSAWKSYQDEDIKFTVRRHNFNESTGTIRLTNNNHEFFTLSNVTGRFTPGELIYQELSTPANVAYSSVTGSKTLSGGSGFDTVYAAGDYIKLTNTSTSKIEIHKIASITNTSELVLETPTISNGAGTHLPIVVGELDLYDVQRNPFELHLVNSSATTTKQFNATGIIKGLDSASYSTIASIDNINLSYIQPMIMRANDSTSRTNLSGTFVPPSDVNSTYLKSMRFNDNNYFSEKGVIVYSKSNDPSGTKDFVLNIGVENGSNVTSTPFVDIEASKLIAYQYKLTNTAADTAKYISKKIELAEDLDAEDFNLILTAYRPTGADIKCYIKAQNGYDNDEFDNLPWTELELFEGVGSFSTISNLQDFREFKFRIANANKVGGLVGGAFTYTSQGGAFEGFKRFQIRIDMLSPNIHNVPILKDYRGIALT